MSEVAEKNTYNSVEWWSDVLIQYNETKAELYPDKEELARGIVEPLGFKERCILHDRLIKLSTMMGNALGLFKNESGDNINNFFVIVKENAMKSLGKVPDYPTNCKVIDIAS